MREKFGVLRLKGFEQRLHVEQLPGKDLEPAANLVRFPHGGVGITFLAADKWPNTYGGVADGLELLTGTPVSGSLTLPPGGVAVVREPRSS